MLLSRGVCNLALCWTLYSFSVAFFPLPVVPVSYSAFSLAFSCTRHSFICFSWSPYEIGRLLSSVEPLCFPAASLLSFIPFCSHSCFWPMTMNRLISVIPFCSWTCSRLFSAQYLFSYPFFSRLLSLERIGRFTVMSPCRLLDSLDPLSSHLSAPVVRLSFQLHVAFNLFGMFP